MCAKGPGLAGCGKTYVLAEPVEEFVTAAALIALDSPELAQAVRGASNLTSQQALKMHVVDTVAARLCRAPARSSAMVVMGCLLSSATTGSPRSELA